MEGIYLLHKILIDNRPDMLIKVNRRWLVTQQEKEFYVKIKKHLKKYGVLPTPNNIPVGFTNEPLEYYIDLLRKRYFAILIDKLKTTDVNQDNIEKVLDRFVSDVRNNELMVASHIVPEDSFNEFVLKTIEDARLRRVSGIYGYPTGYPTVDIVTGGFLQGDIFVISARLKQGKTIYMLNMLRKLAKQHSCLFISMEMGLASIVRRLVFLETRLPQVVTANRIISSFYDEEIKQFNLKVTLVNGAGIKDVSDVTNFILYYKPEIVFIDGAYLIPTEKIFKSEWERAKYIIEELRRIALMTNKPIVCSYQLNRQAVKAKEPKAEHIAFTDAIAQSASVVLAIHDGDAPNEKKFYIIANREGESDINIRVYFDWSSVNFEEIMDRARIEYVESDVLIDEEEYLQYLEESHDETRET